MQGWTFIGADRVKMFNLASMNDISMYLALISFCATDWKEK